MTRLRRWATALALWPTRAITRHEFNGQRFKRYNERPAEFACVFRHLRDHAPQSILDVGTGTTALPHLLRNCGPVVTAIDNIRDYWPRGMQNRHWFVLDDDVRDMRVSGPFDLVTCISTLEHVIPADVAVSNMLKVLKPGGHLIITCPYTEHLYSPNVYALPGSKRGDGTYPAQSFSREDVDRWQSYGCELVTQEFWRYWTGDVWGQGEDVIPPEPSTADTRHQHTCLVFRKGNYIHDSLAVR